MQLTAVFDIGKTNKKFFLFDPQFEEVHREYISFPEIEDEDGFPCEDLTNLTRWMKDTLRKHIEQPEHEISHLNISTYGASLVHLDESGLPVTPLYNYLKPLPDIVRQQFYDTYGDPQQIALETASPALGMLNSGLQLYWLKHQKQPRFKEISTTQHFPQYASYLFSQKAAVEYTSLGCHTALWHFEQADYHPWVYQEKLDRLFPPVGPATAVSTVNFDDRPMTIGVGIHDSSAALLPYLRADPEPFLLLSTGTWSIAMNPFSRAPLTREELRQDCLNYLQVDGKPVKASRLFLGQEYDTQVQRLGKYFRMPQTEIRSLSFRPSLYEKAIENERRYFEWQHLDLVEKPPAKIEGMDLSVFPDFEAAYHQLMFELMEKQLEKLALIEDGSEVGTLYVDGGFTSNDLYLQMLARARPQYKVVCADASMGTALGAALAVRPIELDRLFLADHYALQPVRTD